MTMPLRTRKRLRPPEPRKLDESLNCSVLVPVCRTPTENLPRRRQQAKLHLTRNRSAGFSILTSALPALLLSPTIRTPRKSIRNSRHSISRYKYQNLQYLGIVQIACQHRKRPLVNSKDAGNHDDRSQFPFRRRS